MIDISAETIITLTEAAARLPRRRRGAKPHVATVYRWAQRGIRRIRLETVQVGGTKCTSVEALQRFFERLGGSPTCDPTAAPSALTRQRSKAIELAEAELREAGL